MTNWTIISATNNDTVLRSCLLGSPGVNDAAEVMLQRGYSSAAAAYNDAIDRAKTDLLLFVHQDVYLPEGWFAQVEAAISLLSKQDPGWGVLGVWGGTKSGLPGYMYWTGVNGVAGRPFKGVLPVSTLDEVVLIFRKSSGLRFDQELPGYHMYGTDICLEAGRRGMKCYVIPAFCIHNTNGYKMLPMDFWKACLQMRRKWKAMLPIISPCVDITYWGWPMIQWNVMRAINLVLGRHKITKPVEDPAQLYRRMVDSGTVVANISAKHPAGVVTA